MILPFVAKQVYMADSDDEKLNFYSKNTRAKEYQGIDSLYTLIHSAHSFPFLEIHILSFAERKERSSRKASVTPQPKRSKTSAKPREVANDESEESERRNIEEINEKLQKLKRMEKQFHEEMDRRGVETETWKEQRDQQRRQKGKNKTNLINVVDIHEATPNRKQSDESGRKMSWEPEGPAFVPEDLDFEDYYRDSPEVKINTAYEATPETRKQLREMIEMQRHREKEVQSVDEDDNAKTASIVIERVDISANRGLGKESALRSESKNLCEVELGRSRSEDTVDQHRISKEEVEVEVPPEIGVESQAKESHNLNPSSDSSEEQEYSPIKNVNFNPQNQQFPQQQAPQKDKSKGWGQPPNADSAKQVQSLQFFGEPSEAVIGKEKLEADQSDAEDQIEIEQAQSQKYSESQQEYYKDEDEDENGDVEAEAHNYLQVKPHTGTEEGSQFKDEMADQVDPIVNKSQQFAKLQLQGGPLYHSQTNPNSNSNSKLKLNKEVKSVDTDSLDNNPLQVLSEVLSDQERLQKKKSSFKKLMAENRANLVPRMAISTILNEKINEALEELKSQQPQQTQSPNLQESIINSEVSSPPSKKKINFKQRLAEQQLDKSLSRESGKPQFDRNPVRSRKNRGLLAGFFADN